MKQEIVPLHYPVDGNKTIEYKYEVMFPINGVLARTLQKNEQVKIIRLMNNSAMSRENAKTMEAELRSINENIGAFLFF